MSNKINDIIREHLESEIIDLDSNIEELAMSRPEFLKMGAVEQMEAMQDYINYLKYRQSRSDEYADYRAEASIDDYPRDTGDLDVPYDPDEAQEYEHWE